MATLEVAFLHNQLEERKRRLEAAIALAPRKTGLAGLLQEVDSALERMTQAQSIATREPSGWRLGDQLSLRAGRPGQRRLLRPDPV